MYSKRVLCAVSAHVDWIQAKNCGIVIAGFVQGAAQQRVTFITSGSVKPIKLFDTCRIFYAKSH